MRLTGPTSNSAMRRRAVAAARPRRRASSTDIAALATLTLAQARAVAPLLRGEPARIAMRDGLIIGYRRLLAPGKSATRDAQRLADEVANIDPTHPQAELLALVRRLSRNGTAPVAKVVERTLLKADRDRDALPKN